MNLEKTLEEIETSGKIISDTKIEQIPIYGTDVSGYGSRDWLIEVIAGYEEKEVPKNSLKERKKARKELKKILKRESLEKEVRDKIKKYIQMVNKDARVELVHQVSRAMTVPAIIGGLVIGGFAFKGCLDEGAKKNAYSYLPYSIESYEHDREEYLKCKRILENASPRGFIASEYPKVVGFWRKRIEEDEEKIKDYIKKGEINGNYEYFERLKGHFGNKDWWKGYFGEVK